MKWMKIPEEYIETLAELGLTHTEAKVYITLLSLKTATAKDTHKDSKIARQEVYRVLSDLEEKGLIEKIIARPSQFKPIPARDAVAILIQNRNKQSLQLQKKAIKQFRNLAIERVEALPHSSSSQFVMLSKNEIDPAGPIGKIGKAIYKAQKNVMCSITFPVFNKAKLIDEHIWKKVAGRGVRFKFIISRESNADEEFNPGQILENNDCFEVRWATNVIPASMLLIDRREVFCRLGHDTDGPVLWSNNFFFVAMIIDYFETKWKSLERISKKDVLSPVY
jgi:sugar-specific transcriptional regulator TrmB